MFSLLTATQSVLSLQNDDGLICAFRLAAAITSALLVITSSVQAAKINIKNRCSYDITACDEDQTSRVTCYVLKGGANSEVEIDVGANWTGGTIWGLNSSFGDGSLGYQAKSQANLAEFTVGVSTTEGLYDYYDISNVNAYNLPLMISSQFQDASGKRCPNVTCTISDLAAFCQPPNYLTGGPGYGCVNAEGTSFTPTNGTRPFKTRCPGAYSYSGDDTISVCQNGSIFEVVFCP